MDLIALKEANDRFIKLQDMIQSLEGALADGENLSEGQKKQLEGYAVQCRSEAEGLRGCCEEYESAWEKKRAEVETSDGDTWGEIQRCQEEILKAEGRLRTLEEANQTETDPQELQYLKEREVEHMQAMAEVIQWLVIEA